MHGVVANRPTGIFFNFNDIYIQAEKDKLYWLPILPVSTLLIMQGSHEYYISDLNNIKTKNKIKKNYKPHKLLFKSDNV